jgi:hydroxylamine reductase (hybrid-cluster protein)
MFWSLQDCIIQQLVSMCAAASLLALLFLACAVLLSPADRMFTTGEVGVVASEHLPGTDYSAVVQKALELPGFSHEPEPKFVTVGFGHETTLGAAGVCEDCRAGVSCAAGVGKPC